jgi:hypothetical protein
MRVGQGKDGGVTLASAGHPEKTEPKEKAPEGEAREPSAFQKLLHGLGDEVDRGERMVKRALGAGGADLGPGELLALQAGVYRYSEAVDLSAKLVDRATGGVKTVIQGQ